jgi:hypothetical protein
VFGCAARTGAMGANNRNASNAVEQIVRVLRFYSHPKKCAHVVSLLTLH